MCERTLKHSLVLCRTIFHRPLFGLLSISNVISGSVHTSLGSASQLLNDFMLRYSSKRETSGSMHSVCASVSTVCTITCSITGMTGDNTFKDANTGTCDAPAVLLILLS